MKKKVLARDVMTPDPITIRDDVAVAELGRLLTEHHIGGVPVVDARGGLLGVVSASDIVANELKVGHKVISDIDFYRRIDLVDPAEMRGAGMSVEDYSDELVRDIMTPVVVSATPDATLSELAERMAVNRIHRILITEEDRLLGVVTAFDLLGYIPREPSLRDGRRTILWATDLGASAETAGHEVATVARELGASLTVLHVIPDLRDLWSAYGQHEEIAELQQRLDERALERLNDLLKKLEQQIGPVELIGRTGDPATVILEFARERRPLALAIGTERPESERLPRLGSVAEKVLASSPVPVLTITRAAVAAAECN